MTSVQVLTALVGFVLSLGALVLVAAACRAPGRPAPRHVSPRRGIVRVSTHAGRHRPTIAIGR